MATWSDPDLRNSSLQSRECGVDVRFEHVFVCVDGLCLTKTKTIKRCYAVRYFSTKSKTEIKIK